MPSSDYPPLDPLQTLLQALHHDPMDATAWLALADCLEEQGTPEQGELIRLWRDLHSRTGFRGRRQQETRLQSLLLAGVKPCMPTLAVPLNSKKNSPAMQLVLIPPGSILIGARQKETGRDRDEIPRHHVTLTRPFYMGVYPVTQKQWAVVQGTRPSHFKGDTSRPVEQVHYEDALAFCENLSIFSKRQVRLPSEAEWEYACRACTLTPYATGATETAMRQAGWCNQPTTQPVAQKIPNAWGLHDMHGNVWEWTSDGYENYPRHERIDPSVVGEPHVRVARGGSYSNPPTVCRSASRIGFMAGGRNDFIGFRVVIDWESTTPETIGPV